MKPYWIAFPALALAAACGGEPRGSDQAAATPQVATAPIGGGTINGTVLFRGTPPTNPVIDMSEEPSCKAKYTSPPRDHQVVVEAGKLANAFVYVKSGLPTATPGLSAAATTLDQDGCLYHPRILGVMVNQPIKITNNDGVLHNIKAVPTRNRGFNISQPTRGMETQRAFPQPELAVPLECSVHGWMHARVFVMDHPFFAISRSDGTFNLSGLPPGTYTIEAWHEKLGTRELTVTLTDSPATAAFTFGA